MPGCLCPAHVLEAALMALAAAGGAGVVVQHARQILSRRRKIKLVKEPGAGAPSVQGEEGVEKDAEIAVPSAQKKESV